MFNVGDKVTYITTTLGINCSSLLTIESDDGKIVSMLSGSFSDMGPFSMTFDKSTGMGVGEYSETQIVHGHRKMVHSEQLLEWIGNNIDGCHIKHDRKRCMLGFIAMCTAKNINNLDHSALADLLLCGISKITDDDAQKWLDNTYNDLDAEDANNYILDSLNQYFNTNIQTL